MLLPSSRGPCFLQLDACAMHYAEAEQTSHDVQAGERGLLVECLECPTEFASHRRFQGRRPRRLCAEGKHTHTYTHLHTPTHTPLCVGRQARGEKDDLAVIPLRTSVGPRKKHCHEFCEANRTPVLDIVQQKIGRPSGTAALGPASANLADVVVGALPPVGGFETEGSGTTQLILGGGHHWTAWA